MRRPRELPLERHWSHAGEASCLALIERSEFGPLNEQAQGRGLGHAGNAHEDGEPRGEIRIPQAQALKLGVDRSPLAGNLAQPLVELAPQQGRARDLLPVESGGAVLDQRLAGHQPFLHRVQGGAEHRPGRRREQGSKASQQGGIEPIGFGELTQGFSEAAGVAGIDLRQRQAGTSKTPLQHAVRRAGRLEDHALDGMAGEPGDEGTMAFGIVGEVARCPIRAETDIEPIFGNVDAGGL